MNSGIHLCRVTEVKPDQRVITAISTHDGTPFKNIAIASPQSASSGSGLDIIPTEGSFCLVCRTMSGEAFVLGFVPLVTTAGAGFRTGRRETGLPPGTVSLSSTDRLGKSEVLILPGGVVSISSSAGNRMLMTSDEDLTEFLTRNFEIRAATGSLRIRMAEDRSGSLELKGTETLGDKENVGTITISGGKISIINKKEVEVDGASIQLGFGEHLPVLKTLTGYDAALEALNNAILILGLPLGVIEATVPNLAIAGEPATAVNTPNNTAFKAIQEALERLKDYLEETKKTTKVTAE